MLAQTLGDFELVVVDNQSTDATYEILRGYRDPRLRLLRNDANLGPERNWNRATQEARGRLVKLLCADDLLCPTCLERQVAALDAEPDVALTGCPRDVIDQRGRKLMVRGGFGRAGRIAGREALRRIVRSGTNLIGEPGAVLFRAESWRRAGTFDGSLPFFIDLDMWCRPLATGDFYAHAEPLCAFRVSRTSWSARLAGTQAEEARRFYQKVRQQWAPWLGAGEVLLGTARATVNAYLRQVLYRLL